MNASENRSYFFTKYKIFVLFYICLLPLQVQACFGGLVNYLVASTHLKNITSPNYPFGYPTNASCAWRLTAPPGYIVKLQITAVVDCSINDRLELYDSEREEYGALLERICLRTWKHALSSSGQVLHISFSSNSTYEPAYIRSFRISYFALFPGSVCSSSNTVDQNQNIILKAPNGGFLTSPNFPNKFPSGLNCKWKIFAPPGHVVKLYFNTVNINTTNCLQDRVFLRVTDGLNYLSPTLRDIWCQFGLNSLESSFYVLSSSNKLRVDLFQMITSDVTGYGFQANYTFESLDISGNCGAGRTRTIHLQGQGATFSSPNFGLQQPSNMVCWWNITVDPGFIIEIYTISNRLTMDCESEFVKIHDGATRDQPALGTLCNLNVVRYVYSTGNNVLVEMRTSSSNRRGYGFQMSYRAVKYEKTNYMCSAVHSKLQIDQVRAKIVSPWYPTSYPNNAYCIWTYKAPFARVANLTITQLHLQDSKFCQADIFEVFEAKKSLEYRCGKVNTPISFVSRERKLEVRFKSDWIGRYSGFEAVFDSIEDPSFGSCTLQGQDNYIILNTTSGVLSSPGYPRGIPANMMCTWLITADEGNYVRLEFDVLDFSYSVNCEPLKVEIRDSTLSSKDPITYCNQQHIKKLQSVFSSGRHLWIRFTHTDRSRINNKKGFSATYSTVKTLPLSISCRDQTVKDINLSSGKIASHDYPLNYSNNALCQWQITVPRNQRVQLTFDSFDIQKTPGCTGDFVEVFDGINEFGNSLGKFCGEEKPKPLYSSGRFMHIKFQSDDSGRSPGFKASFEAEYDKGTLALIVSFSVIGVVGLISLIAGVVLYKRYCRSRGRSEGEILQLKSDPVEG